jgi:phosphatidate cytidylyltransferase
MLKTRILTALILLPLVLIILLFTSVLVFELASLILVMAAAWEWAHLAGFTSRKECLLYVIVIVAASVLAWQIPFFWTFSAASLWWLCAALLVVLYPHGSNWWGQNRWLKAGMGFLVLVFFWVGLLTIRHHPQGIGYLLLALCIIWAADTGAYFTGRKWGKHKLAPVVSPGQTWQGLIGGLVVSLVVAWVGGLWLGVPVAHWLFGTGWVVLTVIASVFGDLFESMFKRQVGVKDSGTLLPGHGGLLDRLDSLTAALPIFAFGMILMMRL